MALDKGSPGDLLLLYERWKGRTLPSKVALLHSNRFEEEKNQPTHPGYNPVVVGEVGIAEERRWNSSLGALETKCTLHWITQDCTGERSAFCIVI